MEYYKTKPLKYYCCWVIRFRFNSQSPFLSETETAFISLLICISCPNAEWRRLLSFFACRCSGPLNFAWPQAILWSSLLFSLFFWQTSCATPELRYHSSCVPWNSSKTISLFLNSSLRPRYFPVPTGSPAEEQVEVKDSSLTALPTFPCISSLFCYMCFSELR